MSKKEDKIKQMIKANFSELWRRMKLYVSEHAGGGRAGEVTFSPATDTEAGSVGAALNDLNTAVFPLVVGWGENNAGTYEVGTAIIPTATATATRKGADVGASATMVVSGATVVGLTATKTEQSSGSTSMQASITQGGQTMQTSKLNWSWLNYRYYGAIDSVPTDYAATIATLSTQQLSNTSTLGSTALAAGKYFLFAVIGTPNLVCRHASTDGIIGGCIKGTAIIARKNGSGSDTYSYILIPASTQSWNFKITNA